MNLTFDKTTFFMISYGSKSDVDCRPKSHLATETIYRYISKWVTESILIIQENNQTCIS